VSGFSGLVLYPVYFFLRPSGHRVAVCRIQGIGFVLINLFAVFQAVAIGIGF
jgi:hypothetical protein